MQFVWEPLRKEQSERAICRPGEFYQRFFEEAPVASFSVGVDARIQALNDKASRLLGYRRDQLLGRTVFDLYADGPRGKPQARDLFRRFRAGLEINREDVEMRHADGSSLPTSLSVRPITGADGHVIASCSIVEEIVNHAISLKPMPADVLSGSETPCSRRSLEAREKYATRLIIRSGRSNYFVNVHAIDWISAAGNYAQLHIGSKLYLVRETMNSLEARLDPNQFVRVHRGAIANVLRMKELQPCSSGNYKLFLEDGTLVPLSRTYLARLKCIWLS